MKRTVMAVLLALMLVLAGCSGGVQTDGSATTEGGSTAGDGETTAAGSDGGSDGQTSSTGTVNFYVSDERNAIDNFEHLNVTITKVGFEKSSDGGEKTGDANADDGENETTVTTTASTEVNASATTNASAEANATETSVESNATATAEANASATADGDQAESNETADGGDAAEGDNDGNEKKGGWTEFDVDSQTVDLTQLQGANATSIGSLSVEEGTYSKVFIYVSDVEGTLKTGETVNVKLPSNKLQLNKGFTVGSGASVDFVYDVTVFKVGQSGKYILKPVVSESGTGEEVEIRDVGKKSDGNAADRKKGADKDADKKGKTDDANAQSDLNASFVGTVAAGENATVRATQNGTAIADATVTVNGETVGTTDENGELTFVVPENEETLKVTVTLGDAEVELRQRLATSTGEESNDKRDGKGNGSLVAPNL